MTHKHGKFLRLDRVIAFTGRVAISSGTPDPKVKKRIEDAISGAEALARDGSSQALEALAELRDLDVAPLVFMERWEHGTLLRKAGRRLHVPLIAALESWAEKHECAESTRADIRTAIRHIMKAKGVRKDTPASELPSIVRGLRDPMRATPVAFHRLRAYMLSYANIEHGARSEIYLGVEEVRRYRKVEGKRPRKLMRRPLTVAELDAVCAAFTDHVYKRGNSKTPGVISAKDLSDMAWTLAMTGMRPQEYWRRDGATWLPRIDHVWVDGTKTAAAKRPTFPFLTAEPACGEQFFRSRFAAATEKVLREALDAYSLRRTFSAFCEEASVVPSRRESYMGHGPKNVDELYLKTNVTPFARRDFEKVCAWVNAEREQAKQAPKLELAK